jgi:UDPglucose 6-dehydrogenase
MGGLRVGVIGAGYVGLASAVCLAAKGLDTVCVESDANRVDALRRSVPVINEPMLGDLLEQGQNRGVLTFTTDHRCIADRDVVFVCVGTPTGEDGSADLRAIEAATSELGGGLRSGAVVVIKSTVPVGTCRRISERLTPHGISVVSNPEFLREGFAIWDFQHPDRVVIGSDDERAADTVATLYAGDTDAIMKMSLESAELAKYASNAFLAIKASYVNSLAQLCAGVGADVRDITRCMAADKRIGGHHLAPSPGWGGPCLPKDTAALMHIARTNGFPLAELESACETNASQCDRIIAALRRAHPRPLEDLRIGVLGLAFKAGTSDVRNSQAVAICARLQQLGAEVVAYDPKLDGIDAKRLPTQTAENAYVAAKQADAILLLTEWPEFALLDWSTIGRNTALGAIVVDTRNVLDPGVIQKAGLRYFGNGTNPGY